MVKIIDLLTPPPLDEDGLRPLREVDPRLAAYEARRAEAAPEPYPSRNWEELDAYLPQWEREAFEDALENDEDVLHRDIYSTEKHLLAWDALNKMHHWARKNNQGIPRETGMFLYTGDMGKGKSLGMAGIAALAWGYQGIPVISNMSLRFGYVVSGAGIYNAMERAEPGTMIVIDEIAALLDNFSGGANRGRTFSQSMTAFRKKHLLMLIGSANEAGIMGDVRRHARALITPIRYRPWTEEPDGRKVPIPYGDLRYPPFCYQSHLALAEPWEGQRVTEDALRLTLQRGDAPKQQRKPNPYASKWRNYRNPHPGILNLAALVSDTLDRVPVGDGFDVLRDDMTADRQAIRRGEMPGEKRQRPPQLAEVQQDPNPRDFLLWFIPSKEFKPRNSKLKWPWFKGEAAKFGVPLRSGAMRKMLLEDGVHAPADGITVQELWKWHNNQ